MKRSAAGREAGGTGGFGGGSAPPTQQQPTDDADDDLLLIYYYNWGLDLPFFQILLLFLVTEKDPQGECGGGGQPPPPNGPLSGSKRGMKIGDREISMRRFQK